MIRAKIKALAVVAFVIACIARTRDGLLELAIAIALWSLLAQADVTGFHPGAKRRAWGRIAWLIRLRSDEQVFRMEQKRGLR